MIKRNGLTGYGIGGIRGGVGKGLVGVLLAACIGLSACGKSAGESGQESTAQGGALPQQETSLPQAVLSLDQPAPTGTAQTSLSDQPPTAPAASFASTVAAQPGQPPTVSYEILRKAHTDEAGGEIIYAEYPRFAVSGDGYEALSLAVASVNEEFRKNSEAFLDATVQQAKEYKASIDSSYQFGQQASVSVSRCDSECVCIMVSETVEEGGPHPNNYYYTYNLNAKTGERMKLSDVVTVDDALREMIRKQLYENYPEMEFDDALLRQDIASALDRDAAIWYFWEGQLCISFVEGSFGFSHAEGSLGVLLPLE